MGGAARAIELGFFQEAIARSAYEIQKAQESGAAAWWRVNRFADGSPPPPAIETPGFLGARDPPARPPRRGARPPERASVRSSLAALRERRRGHGPLMPPILDAVRARATLGEISDALREVWGVYRPA